MSYLSYGLPMIFVFKVNIGLSSLILYPFFFQQENQINTLLQLASSLFYSETHGCKENKSYILTKKKKSFPKALADDFLNRLLSRTADKVGQPNIIGAGC